MSSTTEFDAPPIKESGHPKGLYVLFGAEMWERFSYYGMRALLVLYLVKHLDFTKDKAKLVYATYTGLVYFSPLIGGFLADKFLGQRKAILIGGIVMALGHFAMASEHLLYLALSLLIIGNGFFKPNISTMVGNLYPQGDARRDGAYTIFYMGINLGAFAAPLACGALGESKEFGYHYGFGLAGVGMVLGLLSFLAFQKLLVGGFTLAREQAGTDRLMPMDWVHVVLVSIVCAGLAYGASLAWQPLQPYSNDMVPAFMVFFGLAMVYVFVRILMTKGTEDGEGWERVSVIMIVSVFSIVFWMAFEQAGGTLTLFADEKTDRFLIGKPFPEADLRLVPAGEDVKSFPNEAKNLVVVGSTTHGPHLRIFDETGKQVADRDADPEDKSLTAQAKKEIEAFEKALQKSWSLKNLTPANRKAIVDAAIKLGKEQPAPSAVTMAENPILTFVEDAKALPSAGKNLVGIATTKEGIQIRIFDDFGRMVTDRLLKKDPAKLTEQENKAIEDFEALVKKTSTAKNILVADRDAILSSVVKFGKEQPAPSAVTVSSNPTLRFARSKKSMPEMGTDLVIVGSTEEGIQLRIFNEIGKLVVDRSLKQDQEKLSESANQEIENFELTLQKTWAVDGLTPVERHVILSSAKEIGGYPGFPASFFQSINPFLIFTLAPLFSIFWFKLDRTRFALTSTAKMGFGLLLLGVGCFLMSQADRLADRYGSVGPQWLALVYLFFTLGEICMSPIGLSLVNKLAPARMASLMMAVWFLCTSIANYLAGTLEAGLERYQINLWVFLIATSIGPGLLLLAVTVPLKKLGHGRI